MTTKYLFRALELAPDAAERILRSVPSDRLKQTLDHDRFSAHEAICHLADFEVIQRFRMTQCLEAPESVVPDRDESQIAIDNDYASKELADELARWRFERAQTLAFLRSVPGDAFVKAVVHSVRGRLTLAEQVGDMVGHDTYQLEHLTRYLG